MPALTCDPVELVRASKCFQCMDRSQSQAIGPNLLCQWANNDPQQLVQIKLNQQDSSLDDSAKLMMV